GKFRIGTAAKTNFLGRYYDAVTPFSTGGQPMQIYYLNTKGISGGNSSAIVLIRYFSSIMCWIILGAALMIAGTVQGVLDGVSGGNLLKITGWIGIGVNLIIPSFVTLFLVLPKLMQKLTVGFVKLGHKMKIVKDVDKTTARATKVVSDFKNSFKVMATSPLNLILLILVCFVESAITFAIPYFVMKAFNCQVDGMLLSIMSLNVFAIFGVSFIPTPGNSGVVESMGALAFSVAAGSSLVWSVITWRLSVFYVYILIGICITVYDMIMKNVKAKRQGENKNEPGK
ncbi:MAG: flippase-like domain-containing protein, partial [Clostridia bacterium]|nr:flippase-like domain-containing protein [Clostridia bacterium]